MLGTLDAGAVGYWQVVLPGTELRTAALPVLWIDLVYYGLTPAISRCAPGTRNFTDPLGCYFPAPSMAPDTQKALSKHFWNEKNA